MTSFIRRNAWRLGRKLYCWARGDGANDPVNNGEYWLLEQLLRNSIGQSVLLDIGANKGAWSLRALAGANKFGKSIKLHAFEPCTGTRSILEGNLSSYEDAHVYGIALSATEGEVDFFINGIGNGTNSLSPTSGATSERVKLSTVDEFIRHHNIEYVTMMKVDTEGFDLDVLKGAAETLVGGRIGLVQFEYNWRWLLNKASLLEVFSLIESKALPYRLGKLAGESIVFYDKWHFELDRFFENNYVLVHLGNAIEKFGKPLCFDQKNVAVRATIHEA
jgi:FkbM family methyltransferase